MFKSQNETFVVSYTNISELKEQQNNKTQKQKTKNKNKSFLSPTHYDTC